MKNQETLGFILSVASQESLIEKANVNWMNWYIQSKHSGYVLLPKIMQTQNLSKCENWYTDLSYFI